MYKALIVDDEEKARNLLASFITEYLPELSIIDSVSNVMNAVKSINKNQPDIVFLDVDMPELNGFQLLDFFEEINFHIIFTTAHSEYAVKAFQVSAIDFLLKPIQIGELLKSFEKVKKVNRLQNNELYATFKSNITEKGFQKIALSISSGVLFVPLSEIIYLQAEGAYTNFIVKEGKKIMVSKKIKEFENVLSPENGFYRSHRSFIVNKEYIKQYIKSDGGSLLMNNNDEVSISKDMKETILNELLN